MYWFLIDFILILVVKLLMTLPKVLLNIQNISIMNFTPIFVLGNQTFQNEEKEETNYLSREKEAKLST